MVYINCWHINNVESYAMWKIYAKENKGIALQTTYNKFTDCLPEDVHNGVVRYIDYDEWMIPEDNLFSSFLFKRESFKYENELRAMFMNIDSDCWRDGTWPVEQPAGFRKEIDIDKLIQKVYIAPNSPSWVENVIRDVTDKYGFPSNKVTRSPMEHDPYF